MNFDPKHVRRALMVAKELATSIDPGFANIQPPMPPEGVPLERAKGGEVKNVLPVGSPERSGNLRQWLGNSFLHVDGNPKTYYHGTSKDKPFTGFKVGRHGAWFTSDPKDASMYAQENDSMSSRYEGGRFVPQNTASRVMPVFLKADNPFFGEFPEKYKNVENYKKAQSDWFDELRANGHDSWIPRSQEGNLAVMLEGPHQVKSAVGNVGTFDPTNPDITKAEGGSVDDHPDQGYAPKPSGILDVDNPGGNWLKENREYSESRGYMPSGAPKSFGKVTAVWRKPKSNEIAPVYLPVSMLAQLPGVMSEQGNVRSKDLDWLVDHMGKTGKLPKIDDREYKPFITVDHRGMPFVSEGNHRIMAAAKLGWDYLPVEVRYFNGAENVDGPLHPDRIREMHGVRNTNDAGINVKTPIAEPEKAVRRALMIAKADGGKLSNDQPTPESNIQTTANPKRILVNAEGKGGVRGIVVPKHMWEGTDKAAGMREVNRARAEVYGPENRDPLTIGQIGKIHKQTLDEHFAKPVDQQIAAEKAALQRLQKARHISPGADTLDESEKLDTVRHERDEAGRTYVAYGSKGVAGHALYTSGNGPNQKQVVLNTCPGQTAGCGGGVGPGGIVDTSRGTCFAPNAESQYVNAAIRRACHAQAKHDPAMTTDWILAHTGALRNAAQSADKKNQVVLFRPNVVDESDTSSRYVISNLNKQRSEAGKPAIIANSYGKTNELHDPENGYFVTYSNAGPKTKLGYSVSENISRDKQRARATISATDAAGRDFQNEQGNNTPPKNSYMVTDVKRGSDLNKSMEKAFKYAKYWSTPREQSELSPEEIAEGPEGHFDGQGNPTTPDQAHYGHTTLNGRRYDYQNQHILHPRLVNVPERKKNKETGKVESVEHLIPTDSRFKDNEYLPEDRFMTKNGKEAGAILMTTPTTSTSNLGHQTSFTHHVDDSHIDYANQNNGEYQIDPPEEQEASIGKEYVPPQEIKFRADGGAVHAESDNDDLAAFPEQSYMAQRHNAHKSEEHPPEHHHAHRAAPVLAPTVDRALQIANRFGMVPGMMGPVGRR
jgi:hypothetical protein